MNYPEAFLTPAIKTTPLIYFPLAAGLAPFKLSFLTADFSAVSIAVFKFEKTFFATGQMITSWDSS